MRHSLAILFCLGTVLVLGGCASTGQQRGLYNNAYVSTSNPAVSISVNGIPW